MVCKLPPRPTCAPDPLTLLRLPPELRISTYKRIWELLNGFNEELKAPLDITRFNFFLLPSELRLHVYEWILKPAQVDLYSYDYTEDSDDEDGNEQTEAQDKPKPEKNIIFYGNRIGPKQTNPAILRTCKTVYAEAKTLLYRPHALILRPAYAYRAKPEQYDEDFSDASSLGRELRVYDLKQLHSIRELSRLQIELFTTSTTREEDLAHSTALASSFRERVKVGKFELKIFNRLFSARDKHEPHHEIEKETTMDLIVMWSKILVPEELHVMVGDKPGIVLECHRDAHGSASKWKSVNPSDDEQRYCRTLIDLLNNVFGFREDRPLVVKVTGPLRRPLTC